VDAAGVIELVLAARADGGYLQLGSGQHCAQSWGKHMHRFKDRRSPPEPGSDVVTGFYRVDVGSLVEIGDQTLDSTGRPCPISLDQVGREVTREHIVLRIERRRQHD